jgi:N-acetylmuramic acid 6-phosphate etherase
MIDLQMTNKKLVERSKRIVMTITGISYDKPALGSKKPGVTSKPLSI